VASVGAYYQDWNVTIAFGNLVGVYFVGMASALLSGEWLMRSNMRRRLERVPAYPTIWKLIPAAFIAQVISMHFLWACVKARRVDWRGVTYALAPGSVRLLEYRPYVSVRQVAERT